LVQKHMKGVKDKRTFMHMLADLSSAGYDQLFSFGISVDSKHPETHITSLGQGGLALPDKTYYTKPEHKKLVQGKYLPFIHTTLNSIKSSGHSSKKNARLASKILDFETKLAQITVSPAKLRDPRKTYHLFTQDELYKLSPMLKHYFDARSRNKQFWKYSPKLLTSTPTFFQGLSKLIDTTPLPTLKAYISYHLTIHFLPRMSDNASYPLFKFFSGDLSGITQRVPRWKRCFYATSAQLRDSVARSFVAVAFPGDSKKKAKGVIHMIEAAFGDTLSKLPWLDKTTRSRAKVKLSAIVDMVGYPHKWKDYKVKMTPDYLINALALEKESNIRNLNKLGKPVDRTHWGMSPAEVNAYYSPETNRIVFPAAILQPPFFSSKMPMAANFGGIGVVMGHELTHGFDDQGRHYWKDGSLHDWWEKKANDQFKKRAQCIKKEYSAFQVPGKPVQHLNGKLTLGENLADNGGLQNSYKAYTSWAKNQPGGLKKQKFGKYTGQQLYFLAFAQSWCGKQKVKAERMQAVTDPHSPNKFRINGAVVNTPAFAEAFGCKAGTKMNPQKKCLVWTPPQ